MFHPSYKNKNCKKIECAKISLSYMTFDLHVHTCTCMCVPTLRQVLNVRETIFLSCSLPKYWHGVTSSASIKEANDVEVRVLPAMHT